MCFSKISFSTLFKAVLFVCQVGKQLLSILSWRTKEGKGVEAYFLLRFMYTTAATATTIMMTTILIAAYAKVMSVGVDGVGLGLAVWLVLLLGLEVGVGVGVGVGLELVTGVGLVVGKVLFIGVNTACQVKV